MSVFRGLLMANAVADPTTEPLTFTAEEAGATVALNANGALSITNMLFRQGTSGNWQPYRAGLVLTLENVEDSCQFKSSNTALSTSNTNFAQFSIPKKVRASGSVMSLVGMREDCPNSYCFVKLFKDCVGLTQPPQLPSLTLKDYCYSNLFSGCKSLQKAPQLPATELATACYLTMFGYCSALTSAADLQLPAKSLQPRCYQYMFAFCSGLITAPQLPATVLADRCYYGMFRECPSLTDFQQVLPATQLATYCYYGMLGGDTIGMSGRAPEIPAGATFPDSCCTQMFVNANISSMRVNFTEWPDNISDWVLGVPNKGTFYKPTVLPTEYGASRIPEGWTVVDDDVDPVTMPITFTAKEAEATVTLGVYEQALSLPGIHYRMGKSGEWLPYTIGTAISLPSIGDSVQFWNSENTFSTGVYNYAQFRAPKTVEVSGNIQSLLNWREDVPSSGFIQLFAWGNNKLASLPLMPSKNPSHRAYYHMLGNYATLYQSALVLDFPLIGSCAQHFLQFLRGGLKSVEILGETTSTTDVFAFMRGVSTVNEIKVHFTTWSGNFTNWVLGVAATGTFYKPSALPEEYGASRIPEGWTVVNID